MDQAFKDIVNSFNYLNKNGIIILHDYYAIKSFEDFLKKIYGPFFAVNLIRRKVNNLKVIKISLLGNLIRKKTTLAILN